MQASTKSPRGPLSGGLSPDALQPSVRNRKPAAASVDWASPATREELEWLLAELRTRLSPTPQRLSAPTPAFGPFALRWLERQKVEGGDSGHGLAEKSRVDLEWRLSNHLLPVFGASLLDEITIEQVDAYRLEKVRSGALGASTINKTIATLAAILDTAVEYGLIERNPAQGRRRRLPASPPTRTTLDRADQICNLLQGAARLDRMARTRRGQRRALLALLTFAGLRIGEALALRWRDVDLHRGTIVVRQAKTQAGTRTVNLLPVLHAELKGYRTGVEASADTLVFASDTGTPHSATNIRRRMLARAVEVANEQNPLEPLPEGLTPHSLRRTFASLLFALGESPPYVMAQMGHTTAAFTLAIYAREMGRRDGEPERLRAITSRPLPPIAGRRAPDGEEWACR
jgi:integrase